VYLAATLLGEGSVVVHTFFPPAHGLVVPLNVEVVAQRLALGREAVQQRARFVQRQ